MLPGQSVRERGGERKRESEKEGEREKQGGSESEKEGERVRERERERYVEYGCFIYIFNRNDGCLGTFQLSSYISKHKVVLTSCGEIQRKLDIEDLIRIEPLRRVFGAILTIKLHIIDNIIGYY